MPSISNLNTGAKALITGANGFVGTHLVGSLLRKGYEVNAVVRNKAKGTRLLELYDETFPHKLKIVVIPDFTESGAFDEAVQGIDAIFHTASPMGLTGSDPQDIIEPSIRNVLQIMNSCLKSSTLKRFVYTSSCVAIVDNSVTNIIYTEKNWNDASVKECEDKGAGASSLAMYRASKTLAERSAWKFVEDQKSNITWDLTVINPPWIFGPILHDCPTLDSLGDNAVRMWYDAIVKGKSASPSTSPGRGWVDVRDIADAHVQAIEVRDAGGERIICSAGSFVWQDFIDVAQSLSPSPYEIGPLAKGTPEEPRKRWITFDTTRAITILGMKFRTMEETAKDMLTQYNAKGW